jgi:hypothetical protein
MVIPKVFLGTVCNWHSVPINYHLSLMLMDKHYMTYYAVVNTGSVAVMRNRLVEEFLATDATHLMMCDADGILPQETMNVLVRLNMPVVSGIEYSRQQPRFKSAFVERVRPYMKVDYHEPIYGLTKAYATGFPAVVIQRWVLEKIGFPYFEMKYLCLEDGCDEQDVGKQVSTDMWFAEKCYQADIPIYVYPLFIPHIIRAMVVPQGENQIPVVEEIA